MAEPDDSVPVDHELRRPKVAKIAAKNLLFIVDHDGILDAHFLNSCSQLRCILLVIRTRHVDANDYQTIPGILFIEIHNVRSSLDAGCAVERPKINDDNFTLQRLERERRPVDPVGFPDLIGFIRPEVLRGFLGKPDDGKQ